MVPDRLTVIDIARSTGMSQPALYRYLAIKENRVLFGGEGQPATYPAESIRLFERLALLHTEGAVTQQTLAKTWKILTHEEGPPAVSPVRDAPSPSRPPEPLLAEVREDVLLTEAEAAARLACAPERVARYVERARLYWQSEVDDAIRSALDQMYGIDPP